MRPTEDIKKLINKLNDTTSPEMDKKVLNDALKALADSKETASAPIEPNAWRIFMKNRTPQLAAAAIILVAVLYFMFFTVSGPPFSVTYAQVIQPILNARTIVFDFLVGEEENSPVIHDVVAGNRIRRTFSNMDTILILDLDNAKMLTLDPKTKGAVYIDIKGALSEQTRNLMEFVRNAVARIKDQVVEDLGQQDIDGRRAVGFRVRSHDEEVTIWADPKTAAPIRIELRYGPTHYILKNIEFDVPVDQSLLSIDVPAGYTLSDHQLDMSQCTEQDFVVTFQLLVKYYFNGNFPESLGINDFMNFVGHIQEEANASKMSGEEQVLLGMHFARGFMFFQQMGPSGIEWRYTGNGVKLGDADKAIFWYKPEGSQNYRIIYGDLTVEDISPENLPK